MLKKLLVLLPIVVVSVGMTGCSGTKPKAKAKPKKSIYVQKKAPAKADVPVVYEKRSPKKRRVTKRRHNKYNNSFTNKLSSAALGRLRSRVRYDGSYVKIAYPWGDVPGNIGVCTDVVIRSYRKLGIDLQSQVHKDMSAAFSAYPNPRKWGLSRPDANIDHRRVYNLRQFFARRGATLPITRNPGSYRPGDLVTWMVGPDLPHIGIVVNKRSKADPRRFMIVHNIAEGPQMEDILFRFPITGHYRYTPAHMNNIPRAMVASHKPRVKRSRGMSKDQLVAAASLLGAARQISQEKPSRAVPVRAKTNRQAVIAIAKPAPAKDESFEIATLNKNDLQILLGQ